MKRNNLILLLAFFAFACGEKKENKSTQNNSERAATLTGIDILKHTIDSITKGKQADIGVAIIGENPSDTLYINGDKHYTLMSVIKFPQAVALMHEIDAGKFAMDQKFPVTKADLRPNTHSPLRDERPKGGYSLTIPELMHYSVGISDNNACDRLFKVLSPAETEQVIHSLGVTEMGITSEYFRLNFKDSMWVNWSTPRAAAALLEKFYKGNILSATSRDTLWNIMAHSQNPENRILGLLPEGTVVAHKTGTSGVNENGIWGAFNDVGVVMLPGGRHFNIAVFVNNSKENEENNARIIAEISKAAWDYFITQK